MCLYVIFMIFFHFIYWENEMCLFPQNRTLSFKNNVCFFTVFDVIGLVD
jgi:hypothetical protein